MQYITQRASR